MGKKKQSLWPVLGTGRSLCFLRDFSQFIQFDFHMFGTVFLEFLTESVEFYCLAQVGNDRFCSVFQFGACPPILQFWSFSRDLRARHLAVGPPLLDCGPCCFRCFTSSELNEAWKLSDVKLCLLEGKPLFDAVGWH